MITNQTEVMSARELKMLEDLLCGLMLADCKHFEFAGTWKVRVVLAMSRAFGNRLLKQCVVAEPEIREEEVDEHLSCWFLQVMGCGLMSTWSCWFLQAMNGLWVVVAKEDAMFLARVEEEPEAVGSVVDIDITCQVVRFHHKKLDADSIICQRELTI